MHRIGAVIQALTGSLIRETDGVITAPGLLTRDDYLNYGLKPESGLDANFNFQASVQSALSSTEGSPHYYPFLNDECNLEVRWISNSEGSVQHILDLAQTMSQAISESKCNSVQKGALSMIGGYAKSYILSLHDDARKYRPNTHGTNVHIVP